MQIIFKNVLPIKSALSRCSRKTILRRLRSTIFSSRSVMKQLQYRLKQDNFRSYRPNLSLKRVYWRKYSCLLLFTE